MLFLCVLMCVSLHLCMRHFVFQARDTNSVCVCVCILCYGICVSSFVYEIFHVSDTRMYVCVYIYMYIYISCTYVYIYIYIQIITTRTRMLTSSWGIHMNINEFVRNS